MLSALAVQNFGESQPVEVRVDACRPGTTWGRPPAQNLRLVFRYISLLHILHIHSSPNDCCRNLLSSGRG
jgi:hypothetical protein